MFRELFRNLVGVFRASTAIPKLPDPVNDNQYLSASASAAIADKSSGAYDQYLFSDQVVEKMPYEEAVDSHLALVSTRLEQRFSREVSKRRNRLILATKRNIRSRSREAEIQARLDSVSSQLSTHEAVLAGEKTGKFGLFWPGKKPDFYSVVNARIRLSNKYTIFILIGIIDIYIIWSSFRNLGIPSIEAAFLTAPAVAAQLAFPHLAGTRLARLSRGEKRKVGIWIEVLILLGIWAVFVYVMASVRVRFITNLIATQVGSVDPSYAIILLLLNVVLLTALGGWLIFVATRENPHELEALASQTKLQVLAGRLAQRQRLRTRSEARLEVAENNLRVVLEEMDKAVNASRRELGAAAKAVYRRALVNQVADADFTSAYLQAEEGKASED